MTEIHATHDEFSKENPLLFRLYNYHDRNDCNLLYINDNPDDLRFNLEIKNISSKKITFGKSTQSDLKVPSSNNYHIELKFRPNQLSQRSREKIDLSEASKDDWSMSRPYENLDHTVSLFLLKRREDLVIEAKEIEQQGIESTACITLVGLGAKSTEGSRVTSLEITYKDFYFTPTESNKDADAKPTLVPDQKQIIILTVLNCSGERSANLTITFGYGRSILNNGEDKNTVVLQIVNTGEDSITLNENSMFEITIDAQADNRQEPWALAKKDEATKAKVFVGIKEKINDEKSTESKIEANDNPWIITLDKQSEEPRWTIKPNFKQYQQDKKSDKKSDEEQDKKTDGMEKFTLKPHQDFFITIDGIISTLPSGIGNLYVAYYNLPGYTDDKKILNVTKTCITELKESGSGNGRIGINKYPDPKIHLDVKGKIASDFLEVKREVVANSLTVNNTVSARKFEGEGAFVTGMIIMWSGGSKAIPRGWALCNGENNTPDLTDRFIVGAGNKYPVNNTGSGDDHNHTLSGLSGEFSTNDAGGHHHEVGKEEEDYNVSGPSWTNSDYKVRKSNLWTGYTNHHQHKVSIEFNNTKVSTHGVIRPPWYALCFIMKIEIRE